VNFGSEFRISYLKPVSGKNKLSTLRNGKFKVESALKIQTILRIQSAIKEQLMGEVFYFLIPIFF
jgi:hypothetical protein